MTTTLSSVAAKFQTYRTLVEAVGTGQIRCLLVCGGPALGKSFEATAALDRLDKWYRQIRVTRSAGRTTPLALYRDLFNYRTTQDVLVFDDCDDAFRNRECLNILKAATDTRNPRVVSWGSTSSRVPAQRFEFAGRIIIITNRKIDDPELSALTDRAHCFELCLSFDERLERILSLLRSIARADAVYYEVSDWVTRNAQALHERGKLTIRTAVKACELSRLSRNDWQQYANATMLADSDK
jgi:hypothetical protein